MFLSIFTSPYDLTNIFSHTVGFPARLMHNIMKTERKYKYLIISHLRAWGWFLTPLGYIPNINSLLLLEFMMLRSTLLDRKFRSYSFSSLHEFTSWHFTFNFVKFLSYSFRLVYWVKILWKTVSLLTLFYFFLLNFPFTKWRATSPWRKVGDNQELLFSGVSF